MRRRYILICAGTGLLIIAAVLLLPRLLTRHHTLVEALADALQLPPERRDLFFVNLPPAAARYPGSVLAMPQMLVLERTDGTDTGIVRGQSFKLECDDNNAADAVGSLNTAFAQELISNKNSLKLRMTVDDGQVLEMPVDQLKHRLLNSDTVQSAANHGTEPVVITRSYVGRVTIRVSRGEHLDGKLWASMKDEFKKSQEHHDSAQIEAQGGSEDSIEFTIAQPIVFAYEASKASYVTNNLSTQPDDVKLTPVKPAKAIGAPQTGPASKLEDKSWVLATMASGYYPSLQNLNQDWNETSAELVRDTLKLYHPSQTLDLSGSVQAPLSEASVDEFVQRVVSSAKESRAKAIVVYYIGHIVTWPNGDAALVLGTAERIPQNPERPTPKAIGAAVGSNIGDLFKLTDALSANVEVLPKGFLPLRNLYESFAAAGIPFALVIDGCFRNSEFEQDTEALGFAVGHDTREFIYVGADGQANRSLSEFGSMLQHFSDSHPYLHGDNPVIFATKPGTAAFARPNPDWVLGKPVGPLAYRMATYLRAAIAASEALSFSRLLRNITDMNGVGEIESRGSISWSNFSRFEAATEQMSPTTGEWFVLTPPTNGSHGRESIRAQL